jgi:uncharacterized protein (DUF2384 family)
MAREQPMREARLKSALKVSAETQPPRRVRGSITVQSVKKHALDTFGTLQKAEHWLNRPNPLFSGKTPRQILQADPSLVEAELVRIDYGVYA